MIKARAILLAFLLTLPVCLFSNGATNISNSPNTISTFPRITVDPGGYIHIIWFEQYSSSKGDLLYCRGEPGGAIWGEPQKISTSNVTKDACDIDSDGSGRLYAAWIDNNSIKLRINSNGQWHSTTQIASGRSDYYHIKVAVSFGGNIYLVWWTLNGRVYSRARVGGNWENIKQISVSGKRSKIPDIAVGNSQVYACWMQKEYRYEIAYSVRNTSLNSSWSSIKKVYPNNLTQTDPAIEVDSVDVPHIIWTSELDAPKVVHYSYRTGANFRSPEEISSKRMIHYPSLYERDNDLYACWQIGPFGNGTAVFYNLRQGGYWSGEAAVPSSRGSTLSDVSASPDGKNIYLTWDSYDDIYFYSTGKIPAEINKPPVARFSFSPKIGLFPLEVSFDASASYDPDGKIARYDWDFGDGGVGSGKIIKHIYQTWGTFPITLTVVDNWGAKGIEVKVVEVLRLFQPLNIRWETFLDESLFFSRYVIEIYWEKNPKNDEIAEIVFYRIYKKRIGEQNFAYRCIGEVSADIFTLRDSDVEDRDIYVYTVTSVDSQGHESPIIEGVGGVGLNNESNQEILVRKKGVSENR